MGAHHALRVFVLAVTSLGVVTPALGQMQGIAIDNVTATNGGTSDLSFNHTIGGGTNRYLVVAIGLNRFQTRTVDTVTYNGVALTQVGTETIGAGCSSHIWALGHASLPAAGTYSVSITIDSMAGVNRIFGTAISFTGVDQNNLPSSKQSNSSTSTNDPTVDITTQRAQYVLDCACLRSGSSSPSLAVGPGQTERSNQASGAVVVAVSNEPGVNLVPPSTGTTTMSWTGTLAGSLNGWATSAIVIKPASTTAIRLADLEVRRSAGAAQVLWRTGFELDTLGFDIYRDDGFGPVRINPAPIVGSALRAGAGLPFSAGRTYRFDDRGAPPQPGTRYFLEEIDMQGRRSRHGPAITTSAPAAPPRLLAAPVPASGAGPSLDLPAPPYAESALVPPGPAGDTQRRLAAGGLIKIGIARGGWYELDQQTLVAAGLDGSVDPTRLSLWQEGRPVPLWLRGHEDGRFDAGDGIGFHAQGLNSPHTDTRVYWLGTSDGPARLVPAGDQAGPAARTYPAVVEHRPREIYFSALQNGPEENFFGPTVAATPLIQSLPLAEVAAATDHPFALTVGLQGVSSGLHRIQVAANGMPLGTLAFADRARRSFDLPLPPALLTDGELEITLTAGPDGKDVSLLDFLRLQYPRQLVASSGRLWATLPGGVTAQVEGFGAQQRITAVDITDPHAPAWFFQTVAGQDGSARIPIAGIGIRQVLVTDQTGTLIPAFLTRDTSSLAGANVGADLVVVGPASLLPAVAPLLQRRQTEGWQTSTVPLEDVFDEYSFGAKHPGAIRAFVQAARERWHKPPRALLLLGDASFDPRNLLGKGDFDLLPTRLVETRYMETAWDDWFTDFDDDGIADIPVGRLPARTGAELTRLVDKILDAPPTRPTGEEGAVAVLAGADDDIHPFSVVAQELAALAAGHGAVVTARQTADARASQQALAAAIAQDPILIAFAGHGSETQWAGGWLSNDQVGELPAGSGRGGFWVALTCLNGFFHDIHQTSLAETLLFQPRGGAFGVWASSGVTGLPDQTAIGRGFLAALLEGGIPVGEAAARAKRLTTDPDVRRTWVLLGDPSWTWRAARAPTGDAGPGEEPASPPPDAGPSDGNLEAGAGDSPGGVHATSAAEPAPGCGCRTGPAPSRSAGWSLGLLALALLTRWRRRTWARAVGNRP